MNFRIRESENSAPRVPVTLKSRRIAPYVRSLSIGAYHPEPPSSAYLEAYVTKNFVWQSLEKLVLNIGNRLLLQSLKDNATAPSTFANLQIVALLGGNKRSFACGYEEYRKVLDSCCSVPKLQVLFFDFPCFFGIQRLAAESLDLSPQDQRCALRVSLGLYNIFRLGCVLRRALIDAVVDYFVKDVIYEAAS